MDDENPSEVSMTAARTTAYQPINLLQKIGLIGEQWSP